MTGQQAPDSFDSPDGRTYSGEAGARTSGQGARWAHVGCGGTVTFDISGGWCGVCEAEGLGKDDVRAADDLAAAKGPGQAAHAAACVHEGIDDAEDVAALWQGLEDSELNYWADVERASVAAYIEANGDPVDVRAVIAEATGLPVVEVSRGAARERPETTGDWTRDPETRRSNSSAEFKRLQAEVERLIRGDAHKLIAGRADMTAGLIMAQLAHLHGLAPAGAQPALRADAETAELLRADLADAEAQLANWPRCPSGCRCRIGTDDADARECGCDGPCTTGWDAPAGVPVLDLGAAYADLQSEIGLAVSLHCTGNPPPCELCRRELDRAMKAIDAYARDVAAHERLRPADAPAGTGAAPSCPDLSQHRDVYGNPLPLAGTGAAPELAAAMRRLSADMHAEADASGDDAKAAALHEYASRIRLALGPAAALESLEGK